MADTERVNIKLDTDADTSGITRTQARLAALQAQAQGLRNRFGSLSETMGKVNDRLDRLGDKIGPKVEKWGKNMGQRFRQMDLAAGRLLDKVPKLGDKFRNLGRSIRDAASQMGDLNDKTRWWNRNLNKQGRPMRRYNRFLRTSFRWTIRLVAIETLGLVAALSSVNGLLATGRALSRAWQSTVKALGVATANAAAAIAAAIALFTQAQRQFAAAQSSGSYGGDFGASSRALRMVQTDANLAVFGVQALTGAFAAASKNARVTGQTVTAIRGLTDFAVMSGDMEKGLAAAANLVSLLQSGKASGGEEILGAAKQIGPEFEKAYKEVLKQGGKTNAELLKMFASGDLAEAAGVSGTTDNVRGTLMGSMKEALTQFQTTFADFGQAFVTPATTLFKELNRIFHRTLMEISGSLYSFSTGNFMDGLIHIAEKLSEWTVTLFNKYLPMTDEFIRNFLSGWRRLTGWFSSTLERFRNGLNRFSEASSEVNEFLGRVLGGIGRGIRDNFISLADWVVENSDKFQQFGQSVGDFFYDIFRVIQRVRQGFLEASPAINVVIGAFATLATVLSQVAGLLGSIVGMFASIGGGTGLGGAFGLAGGFGTVLAAGAGISMLRGRGPGRSGAMLGRAGRGIGTAGRNVGMAGGMSGLATLAGYTLFDSLIGEGPSYQGLGSSAAKVARNTVLAGLVPTAFFGFNNYMGQVNSRVAAGAPTGRVANAVLSRQTNPNAGQGRMAGLRNRASQRAAARATTSRLNGLGMGPMAQASAALGVGLAGFTATGEATNYLARNKTLSNNDFLGVSLAGSTSFLGGVAGGAGTGALIGMIVPVIGPLIGGLIGGVVGGVMGLVNSGKARAEAAESGRNFANSYADGVANILRAGGLNQAKQAVHDFDKTMEEFAENSAYTEIVFREATSEFDERMKSLQNNIDVMEANVDDLTRASGQSQDEIISLAQSLELDLTGNMLDLQQLLEATGIAVTKFGDKFDEAFNKVMANAISAIDTAFNALMAPAVINEAARGFREIALAGEATLEDSVTLLRTIAEQTMYLSGGDPLLAFENIRANLGTRLAPGTQFTTAGGALFGLQDMFFENPEVINAFYGEASSGLRDILAENLMQEMAGYGISMSNMQAQELLGRLSDDDLIQVGRRAQAGQSILGVDASELSRRYGRRSMFTPEEQYARIEDFVGAAAEEIFGGDIQLTYSELEKTQRELATAVEGLGAADSPLVTAMTKFNDNISLLVEAVGGTMPTTSTGPNNPRRGGRGRGANANSGVNPNGPGGPMDANRGRTDDGDTFSPRRNLVDTMSRHRALDRMVKGNRTLTSSLRNFNLGSGMSDHASGRAFDLVGQNLGQYASMVNATGGYAAFHGAGGSRHLHVVPGSGAIGDTAVPRMSPAMAMSGGGMVSSDQVTINVYPSQGMDEQALADKVVDQLTRAQRTKAERM
jgi:hypothetical protein